MAGSGLQFRKVFLAGGWILRLGSQPGSSQQQANHSSPYSLCLTPILLSPLPSSPSRNFIAFTYLLYFTCLYFLIFPESSFSHHVYYCHPVPATLISHWHYCYSPLLGLHFDPGFPQSLLMVTAQMILLKHIANTEVVCHSLLQ